MVNAEQLRCPNCGEAGGVTFSPALHDIKEASCDSCNYNLSVHNGIPDFAEHIALDDPELNRPQRIMNSRLFASIYETPLWRPLHTRIGSGISMDQEVQEVLRMAESDSVRTVGDLACGTGHYARAFARKLPEGQIYGLDISLSMLSQGHKIALRKGMPNILFLRGDIHLLPFDDESLDQVNCGGALHLFPNLRPIWKEIARVLSPGGVFTAMTLAYGGGLIGRIQQRMVRRSKATFFDPDQLAADLREAGFPVFKYMKHRVSLIFCAAKGKDA